MTCNWLLQTPLGMYPCQLDIAHEHMSGGYVPDTSTDSSRFQEELILVWKELERLKDRIKLLENESKKLNNPKKS